MNSLTEAELTSALQDVLDYWRKWLNQATEDTLFAWQDAATAFAGDCNRRRHELRGEGA